MIWDYFKTKKAEEQPKAPSKSLFSQLKQGLVKTRERFINVFHKLFHIRKLDEDTRNQLLDLLIESDVGPTTSEAIVHSLEVKKDNNQISIYQRLQEVLLERLLPVSPAAFSLSAKPEVIMLVGVNGAGKTTTIGRLAHYLIKHNHSVHLAAGDTFRAAATEQLDTWAERNDVSVTSQGTGADSASVVFDAYQTCKHKKKDVLLADTAGRLHNKAPLMQELQKVSRVLGKLDAQAPHHIWLVLDASIGQNSLQQARKFHESLGLTGLVITKLDGSAKAGIVFAIADELKLPIRFVGVGEKITDLKAFDAEAFVKAFLDISDEPG